MEDALLKAGLEVLLGPFVRVGKNHPVHPPAQFVDVFVASSAEDPEAMWASLGWLGRMAPAPCLMEGFSQPVPENEALECHRKQLNLHHELEREAPREPTPEEPEGRRPLLPLWMLSWGRPETLLRSWAMSAVDGWPGGFYRTAPGLGAWVVVLPELPRVRETLPLRLFGDDDLRYEVAQELKRLPPGDRLHEAVRPMLYRWKVWLQGEPQDERTRRLIMDLEQMVQEDMRRLRDEGETKGLRAAVLDLCEILGVKLDDARRTHITSLDLNGLEALRAALKQRRAWPSAS
jgi:hypothetical protein